MNGLVKVSTIFSITLLMLLANCISTHTKKSITPCEQKILSLIPATEFISIANRANSHMIFIQKQKDGAFKHIRFLVIAIKDCKVLTDQYFLPGYVKWKTNNEIELLSLPEIVPAGKNLDAFIQIISIANLSKQQ